MKSLRYGVGFLGLIFGVNTASFAQIDCAEQYNQIDSNFVAAYAALDAVCYPSVNIPESAISCIFTLSAECVAEYDALGQQASTAWSQFYIDCPDYMQLETGSNIPGPVYNLMDSKKKTKKQLRNEIKTMKIKMNSLKKKLKAARENRKAVEQSCNK